MCAPTTVGVQRSGGRGNRRDELVLILKACCSALFSSFLWLNSRLCGDSTYCRSSVVFAQSELAGFCIAGGSCG